MKIILSVGALPCSQWHPQVVRGAWRSGPSGVVWMLNQASGGTGRVDPESRQHLSSGTGVCFGLALG